LKSCCVLEDHYDEHNKTVFRNTTPNLQDQDQPRPIFWSETGLVLTYLF